MLFIISVFIFITLVSARPLVIPPSIPAVPKSLDDPPAQSTLSSLANSTASLRTLDDLYLGNQQFRQNARVSANKLVDESPSFMFLGCVDNSLTPSTIFNAPAGSIISHNNIANQYSSKDRSARAAVAYAIESLHVQHIIILGHYGCKGVETAITKSSKATRLVRAWVKRISDLYAISRRREIVRLRDSRLPQRGKDNGVKTPPPPDDAGFRALVEENVKKGVKELRRHSILTKAYSTTTNGDGTTDVFVHGMVYDEVTGEVHDLHVSFGPPGKQIPHIPFKAVAAAKNFHRPSDRPRISTGKTWTFSGSN
jgi:carbonic anhydrase